MNRPSVGRPGVGGALLAGLATLLVACSTIPEIDGRSAADWTVLELHEKADQRRLDGRNAEAAELAEFIIQHHYDYEEREEIRFLAAEAWFDAGQYPDAFEHYRRLLIEHPMSTKAPDISRRVFTIGKTLVTAPEDPLFGDLSVDHDVGVEALNYLVTRFPKSPYADDGWKLLADVFTRDGEPEGAAEIYERIIREYPDSEWVDLAMFRTAESYADLTRGGSYDIDPLLWSHAALTRYLTNYPDGNSVALAITRRRELEEEITRRELLLAEYYRQRGSPEGEHLHLANAARRFPNAPSARSAERLLAERGGDEAADSVDLLRPRQDRPIWRRAPARGLEGAGG